MPKTEAFDPRPDADQILTAISDNMVAADPISWAELARTFGISTGLVAYYRSKVERAGGPKRPPKPPSSREDRVGRVTEIAESSREATALKALELLEEWERASGNAAGPGAPLTTAEEVVRLGVLLDCASDESLTLVLASNRARILRLLKLPAKDLPSEVPPAAPLA